MKKGTKKAVKSVAREFEEEIDDKAVTGNCEECLNGECCEFAQYPAIPVLSRVEEAFGNGDLNALKDKINEIIDFINNA